MHTVTSRQLPQASNNRTFGISWQCAISLSPPLHCSTNLSNSTISLSSGTLAFRLCFAADTNIFSTRSGFITLRSEYRHTIGVNVSKPISVAFSTNHSKRSMFFVGATARCNLYGCAPKSRVTDTISTSVRLA